MERVIRLPRRVSLLLALTLTFSAVAVREAWIIGRLGAENRRMAMPESIKPGRDSGPELVFAAAFHQQRQGNVQEALRLYSSLMESADADLRKRIRYNISTIYLADAAKLWNSVGVVEHARISTLVELAKTGFRDVLRSDPGNWDARFNLEYACRITPPPKETEKGDWRGEKTSVFATLPALPGGGP